MSYKIGYDSAENVTLRMMPYSCYILRDIFAKHKTAFKLDLLNVAGLTPAQIAEINGLLDDTTQCIKDEIKEQITYKFRAEFVSYVRENPPDEIDLDDDYDEYEDED